MCWFNLAALQIHQYHSVVPWWDDGLHDHRRLRLRPHVSTGVRQGCSPVPFNIFLLCATHILYKGHKDSSSITVDFGLDWNIFNIKSLQAINRMSRVQVLDQYADDCALVHHSLQDVQYITATVRAYNRLELSVNTAKTEVICQWSSGTTHMPPIFKMYHKTCNISFIHKHGSILSEGCSISKKLHNQTN